MRRSSSVSFLFLLGTLAVAATACKVSLVSTDEDVATSTAGTGGTTSAGSGGSSAGTAGTAAGTGGTTAGSGGTAAGAGGTAAGAGGSTAGAGGSTAGAAGAAPSAALRFANMAVPVGGVNVDICIRGCTDASCSSGNFDTIQPLFRQIYDANSAAYQAMNPPVTPPAFESKFYAPGVTEWLEFDANKTYEIRLVAGGATDCKTPTKGWSDQIKSFNEAFYTVAFIGDEAQQLGITVTKEANASATMGTVRGYNNFVNIPAVDLGLVGASFTKAVGPLTAFAPGASGQVAYQKAKPAFALPGTTTPLVASPEDVDLASGGVDDISVFGYGFAVGDKTNPAMIIVCKEDDEFEFFGVLETGCKFF